jgi:hypothetical protein
MDPDTKEIIEEIPNVDYRQIGEVQFLSVPAGDEYTLKLQGYAEGYFSLDVEEQQGNSVIKNKLFEGIPSSPETSVTLDIDSSFDVLSSEISVDQDGDGKVDIIYPMKNEETPIIVEEDKENNYGYKKDDKVELTINILEKVEKIDEINENTNIAKALSDLIEKPKEEKIENKEIEIPKEVPKDIELEASVVESGFLSNKLSYIIILGLLIVLFAIIRFVKI